MSGIFKFKQFSVDQTGCAMKINTDGVLLGALAEADHPKTIFDIGTGTGVIALMLAQRFTTAQIDAVEIDNSAAETAGRNFGNSPFAARLSVFPHDFQEFFIDHPENKYDLIISNPPFHLNSLESPETAKSIAKHAGEIFFDDLISVAATHLTETGVCWLILPLQTADLVMKFAEACGLYLQKKISIYSFENSEPHREIVVLSKKAKELMVDKFIIYKAPKVYSQMYELTVKNYFTIFN